MQQAAEKISEVGEQSARALFGCGDVATAVAKSLRTVEWKVKNPKRLENHKHEELDLEWGFTEVLRRPVDRMMRAT